MFSQTALLPYARRELEARDENLDGLTTISKAKFRLGVAVLLERTQQEGDPTQDPRPVTYTREYLMQQPWGNIKSFLEVHGGLGMTLKHPNNIADVTVIHDISKGRLPVEDVQTIED